MSVPICTILTWYGSPLRRPLGYEFCNGEIIDRITYPDLYGYLVAANPALYVSPTQARLPDLRGEFVRGYDDLREVDPNRTLGSFQNSAVGRHSHRSSDNVGVVGAWSGGWGGVGGTHPVLSGAQNTPFRTTEDGIHETRPRNINITFIIKATKNGEERPLRELIDDLPESFPQDALKVLLELADSDEHPMR